MAYGDQKEVEPPYTVVGHTSVGDARLGFTFKAGGLRAILDECSSDEDLVHISCFSEVIWDFDKMPPEPKKRHFNHFSVSPHK